jgi:hypothetical protein
LIIYFVYILKEGIIMDHWNVFIMGREGDDLGEMSSLVGAWPSKLGGVRAGPSNLGGARARPSNLGGEGLSVIGGVEPRYKKTQERTIWVPRFQA